MKRKLVAAAFVVAMVGMFSGCVQSVLGESQEAMASVAQEEGKDSAEDVEAVDTPEAGQETALAQQIDTANPVAKGSRISVIAKSTKDEYWKAVREGMKDAVSQVNQAYGYKDEDKVTMTFEGPDDEQGVNDQINTVDAVLAENPTVLCLSAIDADSCVAQLETAHENGIPVVTFDSGINANTVDGICISNNKKIGSLAAQKLAKELGDQGKVAVVAHSEMGQSSIRRVSGFREALQGRAGLEVLDTVYDNGERDLSDSVMRLLNKNEDLAGIFCTNGEMADTVLECVKSSGRQDIAIVGVDGTKAQQEAVRSGQEVGFIAQNPYEIGYRTILKALRVAEPGELEGSEKVDWVKSQWIDQGNLESFVGTKYLQ